MGESGRVRDSIFDELSGRIARELVARSAAGLGVGVARGATVLWQEAFGWADREARVSADAHTPFSVASTSKPVTATAVMILHEQGKIDIDAPINEYLGPARLRARVGEVTDLSVRRVLSHSAGLPSYVQFFYADEPHPVPALERTLQRYGEAMDPPGARFHYTNLGYGVLTHLVERVSGTSFDAFLRTHLFLPLGMTRSSFGGDPVLRRYHAARYWPDGSRIPDYTFDHLGGSALFASVHDLLRFGMLHLRAPASDSAPVLSAASLEDMHRPRVEFKAGSWYGSGWFLRDDGKGHRIVEHAGGMPGVGSDLVLVPSLGLAVVSVVNGHTAGLRGEVTREILRRLAPEHAALLPDPEAASPPQDRQSCAPIAGDWAGTMTTPEREVAVSLAVKPTGDIVVKVGDGLWSLVNDATFADGRLGGGLLGSIETGDTLRSDHQLRLDLAFRDGALAGALLASSCPRNGRAYFTLPFRTRLQRI